MNYTKSNLLFVFLVAILISIIGVGRSPLEPSDRSNCISVLDIVVLNSENMATLDGVNIYLNGKLIGTATNGIFALNLPNNKAPSRYKIEAKRVSSSGCYYGKNELTVDCSDSSGISKSIEIYAQSCTS